MPFHEISTQGNQIKFSYFTQLTPLPHTHISKSQEGHVKYVKWVAVFNSSTKENLSLFVLTILFALKSHLRSQKNAKKGCEMEDVKTKTGGYFY